MPRGVVVSGNPLTPLAVVSLNSQRPPSRALLLSLLCLLWLAGPATSDWAQLQAVRDAIVTLKQGHRDSAEAQLRRLIQAHPQDPLSHQALAALHLSAGRLDSARQAFQRAVDRDSTLAESHHGVAVVSSYAGDWARAFERFGSALDLDPGNPVYHFNAGVVYDHLGRIDEAESSFRNAMRIDPWNDDVRRFLASVLLYQNEPDEALEQYAAACRLAPAEARNWYGVGRVQARLGADSLAAIALERACLLDTSYQKAVYNLSLLYRRLGRAEALALASVVVDMRVTQIVNGVRGVHAVLPYGALMHP